MITRTKEQREKTIEIALDGGDYIQHLKDCGLKNPSGTWFYIRKKLEKDDPEKFEEVERAMHRKANKKWKDKQAAEQLQLEAGKNYEVSVADAMAGMKDAADTFFGKCEEMGLKTEEPKITKPVNYDGFEMTAMRSTSTGIFYEYSDKTGYFFVKVGEDTLDLHIDDWKKLLEEIPRAAVVLGVEL